MERVLIEKVEGGDKRRWEHSEIHASLIHNLTLWSLPHQSILLSKGSRAEAITVFQDQGGRNM